MIPRPLVVAALSLGAVALAVAGCGASPGGSSPANRVTNAGVSLTIPAGWVTKASVQPAELRLASTPSGLTADVPTGPRLTARPSPIPLPDPASFLTSLKPTRFVGEVSSSQGTIAGHPEVSVQFTEAAATGPAETTKTIVVSLAGGRAYVFTLEAPQASWDDAQLSFATALSNASFDLSAIPPS